MEIPIRYDEGFLEAMDGRGRIVRNLRQRLDVLVSDLGGLDQLTYMERSLCRRAIHLERLIEKKEASLAHGGTVDESAYIAALSALGALFTKIGLKRRAKQIQSLSDYVSSKSPLTNQ